MMIPKIIRFIQKEHKQSLPKIAETIGVSITSVCRWEAGTCDAKCEYLVDLVREYKIPRKVLISAICEE